MPLPAIIGGGAALLGGIISSGSQKSAANKAADTSMQTAAMNNALTRDIYNQNKATLSPYVQSGNAAGGQINAMLGLGSDPTAQQNAFDQFRNSTGYQFRLGEGMNALNSGLASSGTLQSGAAMKAAQEYGQNFASNEFGNYMNMLGNQQGVGLAGASALAGVGQNYAGMVSANNNAAGTSAANAALATASNPFANALGMVGGGLLSGGIKF